MANSISEKSVLFWKKINPNAPSNPEGKDSVSQTAVPVLNNLVNDISSQPLNEKKIVPWAVLVKNESDEIKTTLNEWVEKAPPSEKRAKARQKIMDFLALSKQPPDKKGGTDGFLNLDFLNLSELPDIFGHQIMIENLTKLILSSNKLSTLPESSWKLINLNTLNLQFNEIKVLPESIGKLINLSTLYLSMNELTAVPESIGNLDLMTLSLWGNSNLVNLPQTIFNLHHCNIDISSTGISESVRSDLRYPQKPKKQGPWF
ncbi:MAG: hypothetical protein S4CHLAM123_01410 [Chlamydiales bacterium]|nr:hypothetical protein [Chlamydiales bacterium]